MTSEPTHVLKRPRIRLKRRPNLGISVAGTYPEYLTTGVVARHCGVSKVTVLRWIEKGNLTSFRLPGGQNRIHRDDFFAFASKHSIPIRKNIPGNQLRRRAG
jgi:excisionase family DNA binding protein